MSNKGFKQNVCLETKYPSYLYCGINISPRGIPNAGKTKNEEILFLLGHIHQHWKISSITIIRKI